MSMGREYCEKCGEEHGVAYECKPKADGCKPSVLSDWLSAKFIEKAARAIWEAGREAPPAEWSSLREYEKEEWRIMAKAVTLLTLERQAR